MGGPGSQLTQFGAGAFAVPTAPTLNGAYAGGTDITVGAIDVTDLAIGASYTDTYGPTTITVDLKIKDVDSGQTGSFTFTGSLTGTVSSNGTTAASVFSNPFTAASQMQTIGGTVYTVSVNPSKAFSPPGAPPAGGTGQNGAYSFNVKAGMPVTATITCPANITRPNDSGKCGAVVTYPAPATTGTPGTVTCTPPSGSFFPIGTTTVNCTTAAGPGCQFTVTVVPTAGTNLLMSVAAINGIPTTGSPGQATVKVGDCVTLKLVLTVSGCSSAIDVTGVSTFLTNPAQGKFTGNVWCAIASDANRSFPIYGVFVNPFTHLSQAATVHVNVLR